MEKTNELELTILMPCLNEAETLETCIKKAKASIEKNNIKKVIFHMRKEKPCLKLFVMWILLFLKLTGNRRRRMYMNITLIPL